MKVLLAAAFFTLSAGAASPRLPDMTPGRYEVKIEGLLCRTCTRAIVEELVKLKEVQKAVQDFDHDSVILTINTNRTLTPSKLRDALDRAARRVDLGTRFRAISIKYRV